MDMATRIVALYVTQSFGITANGELMLPAFFWGSSTTFHLLIQSCYSDQLFSFFRLLTRRTT